MGTFTSDGILTETPGEYKVVVSKQARKYVEKVDGNTRSKLLKALRGLSSLSGDIRPLAGMEDMFRLKIYQYRILFKIHNEIITIEVVGIGPRGDVYKKGAKS